jgi:hypothetical protein
MKISKFVLNKINFENYKLRDKYLDCFMNLTSITKIDILANAPRSIVQDIESNTITLNTFIQLCKWKKCNVWVLDKCVYPIGTYPPTHIIDNNEIIPWEGQEYLEYYHATHPLYALSHYKLKDLQDIASKLNIPISKTKKQIYSDIQSNILF